MPLPCSHPLRVVEQVQPTARLLSNLHSLHPEVLRQHSIDPADYQDGLVFRSAVESIRGQFIATSTTGREGVVKEVLEDLRQTGAITAFKQTGGRSRYDFTVEVRRDPSYFVALEVKGGEGNSINISERPLWANEFGVWCHLDGAIVNQPAHGAHSIVNRLTNEMTRREKQVDVLFFKDALCGTPARPCPRYPGREDRIGRNVAPDIFLFPRQLVSRENPDPLLHSLSTLELPGLILQLFGVDPRRADLHLWEVRVCLLESPDGRLRRTVQVLHQGQIVDRSVSRPWRP